MIKEDLAKSMAKKFSLTKAESRRIFDHVFDSVRKELNRGRRVEFRGFGTWHTVRRTPRVYQDKNGKVISVPGYRKAVFRQSKNFFK